jgi:two-component system chemotaxis response regulator CheB
MPSPCIAIGGSAGSIEVIRDMLATMPVDLAAPVLAVVHVPPDVPTRLASVLERRSNLPVKIAVDGEEPSDGRVYLAPPDRHLTLDGPRLAVRMGPRHNRYRPSIDPLLWSVGRHADGGGIGVILSGAPGDGVAGARELSMAGGTLLVQDPIDALIPAMPERVLRAVPAARPVATATLATAVVTAVEEHASRPARVRSSTPSADAAAPGAEAAPDDDPPTFACPDCGGVLELSPMTPLRFVCRVGHEYDGEALLDAQDLGLEDALWAAIRALEEQAELARRVAGQPGDARSQRVFREEATDAEAHARSVRRLLFDRLARRDRSGV